MVETLAPTSEQLHQANRLRLARIPDVSDLGKIGGFVSSLEQRAVAQADMLGIPSLGFDPRTDPLLDFYRSSPMFDDLSKEVVKESSVGVGDINTFRGELSGRLFRDLSYIYMSAHSRRGLTVLSPDLTFSLWRRLFSKATVASHRFNRNSFLELMSPDGLVLQRHANGVDIVSVLKYTSSGKLANEKIGASLREYERSKQQLVPLLDKSAHKVIIPKYSFHDIETNGFIVRNPVPFSDVRRLVEELAA